LPLLVVGILVLSGLGAVAFTFEESDYKTLTVCFSEPMIKQENEYIGIEIDGTNTFLKKQGKPMIPSYIHTFSFPIGTKIKKVTCELSDYQETTLTNIPKPTPMVSAVDRTMVKQDVKQINYGSEPYPAEYFNYDLGCGRNRDGLNLFVKIEVFPVKYHPDENKIVLAKNADILVEYELPEEPIIFDDQYEFVVIGPSEFGDEVAPLISHKNNRGISTIFVTLNDIYDGVYFPEEGRDSAEMIKYFIKEAIENWGTSNVLFVGGWDRASMNHQFVPIRETHVYINHPDDPDDEVFASDLYFADIYDEDLEFCSWDSNQNDVFGEFNWSSSNNYDLVDLYPDIYFGRLACSSEDEVNACVNKIITYENEAAYSQPWFEDMVVIGGDTWVPASGDDSDIPEGEFINQHALDIMEDFDAVKIWDTNDKLGTYLPPYGTGHITNAINSGCGFLHWSGHGSLGTWATHRYLGAPGNWIPTLLTFYPGSYVRDNLNNGNKLPITIIGACSTGKFNYQRDCFAWSHVLNPNGASIAVLASSGLFYSAFGNETIEYVAGLIELNSFRAYKELNAITFGEMWAWSIKKYIDMTNLELEEEFSYDYKTMEQWQAFGDPTLAIGPESQQPIKPNAPSGSTEGVPNTVYSYYASTIDPDGDNIYYIFDWGDGTFSDWIGPVESGTSVSENHSWSIESTFDVKVRAKDIHGDQSEWSEPLKITIPRSKALKTTEFNNLFGNLENLIHLIKITFRLMLQ